MSLHWNASKPGQHFGFTAAGFEGDNYVSLYIGDEEANGVADLSEALKSEIESVLAARSVPQW